MCQRLFERRNARSATSRAAECRTRSTRDTIVVARTKGAETRVFPTPLARALGATTTTGARHTRAREMERVRAHRAAPVEGRSLARRRGEARRCARARAVTRGDDADVVVVGSGIGGLTAAAMLAYYGKKVRRARAIGVGRSDA